MRTGGAHLTKPRPANTSAHPARLLAALLFALLLLSPTTGALPGQSDGCDDVDVLVDPGEPTSDEQVHVTVEGVQGGAVTVEWTLTSDSGQIVNAGSTYREASDDDTYHLDPLGPYPRDHTFEATATAEFSDEGRCNETPGPEIPILNAPPTATIQQEPTAFHRGDDVTFTAVDLHDTDGDPIELSWSVNDENTASSNPMTRAFHNLETHTIKLTLDDGIDLNVVTHTTQATNRVPTTQDVQVHPTQVIRNQSVELTWTMNDPDADQGYDTLAPSAILTPGSDPLPLDTPHTRANFTEAGDHPLTARTGDGHTTTEQTVTATVLDRTAPALPQTNTAAQYATLHVPAGSGILRSEPEPPFVHHTWPAEDAAELATRIDWASTQDIKVVTVSGPLPPLIHSLKGAIQDAYADGTTIVVPAPPANQGAFEIQGLAALAEVITVAYGTDGDPLTGCGPAPDLSAKPDLAVTAATQEGALDNIRNILAGYIVRGVSDPLLLRALAAGSAVAGDPFESGAGFVEDVPEQTPLIPAMPLTPYLDFGVVNDKKAQGADVGVLNLNGLNTRLHERFDGSLPEQYVTVRLESEFHYLPDLLEQGFNALACNEVDLESHQLTTPLEQTVPPASLNVTPLVPDLAPLIDEINDLYPHLDPHLRDNDFDNGLTLEQWDQLDQAARTIRDERAGLEDAEPAAAIARMDSIKNATEEICTLLDETEICDHVETLRAVASWLLQETRNGIQAIRNAADTTTLDYQSDPALTEGAARGLYIGFTTLTTTGTLDGEPVATQQAPVRIPTAMLVTGTAVVDVTYPDGSPVANTTVEASSKAVTDVTPYFVDPVSNLFVTIPSGYHVNTDEDGRAVLEHLAPLMALGDPSPQDRWHFGAYYDAPLELTAASGDERLPMMLEPVTDEALFGPSMTMMALAVDRNATQNLTEFILENLDPAEPPERFQHGRELLARDVSKEIPLEIPTGAYTRVVDEIDPTHWTTGTLDDGTLGDLDDVVDDAIGSSNGWVWQTEGDALHGVSTHGQSAGIARYTYPLPDAEHIQLGLNVQLDDDTRGLPFLFATMDEAMTDELDRFLEQTLEQDATDPDSHDTVEALQWFAAHHHMVRMLPLTEPAVAASVDGTKAELYPNTLAGLGPGTTHGVTTEFTLEGRSSDQAALTLVVLPAPVGTVESSSTGTVAPSAPLGGEITMETSLRLLTHKPLQQENGTMRLDNPVQQSQARSWETFINVPRGSGIDLDGIATNETHRAAPPATSGVHPGFQPFVLGWEDASAMDEESVRAYALTEDRPVYITAPGDEATCWFDAAFSGNHYERVIDPRPSGLCVILSLQGKVSFSFPENIEDVQVEAGADAFIFHPFAIHYGETSAAATLITRGTDGLMANQNVTSYQSRWDPHPIAAAGDNHDFIVLDQDLLEQAGPLLEFQHAPMDLPTASYPVQVSPWEHESAPPQPLVDL